MQKNEIGSLSFNINRNQFKDLNVRPKTMKFLENIGCHTGTRIKREFKIDLQGPEKFNW